MLANAISFPAFIHSKVGIIPIIPTKAVTTNLALSYVAASINPSIPVTIFTFLSATEIFNCSAASSSYTHTISGSNSLICSSSFFIFFLAAIATTFKSLLALTISNV